MFSAGRGGGKDCVSKSGKAVQEDGLRLSVRSLRGSSLIPLSAVQGDHRGDAVFEEESLPPSRASRKSSAVLPSGLMVCGGGGYVYIIPPSNQIIIFPHTSTAHQPLHSFNSVAAASSLSVMVAAIQENTITA